MNELLFVRDLFYKQEDNVMGLIGRTKNMVITPKTEWGIIVAEEPNADAIFRRYVLPFVIACSAAGFIGYTFIWRSGLDEFYFLESTKTDALVNRGLSFGIQTLLTGPFSLLLSAFIVNLLASGFGSEKNIGRAMQLVSYSFLPVWVGGLLMIYPPIGFIGLLFGLYGLYLLYLGLPQLMKTPQEKIIPYTVTSIVVVLAAYIGLGLLFRLFLWDIMIDFLKNVQINAHPLK